MIIFGEIMPRLGTKKNPIIVRVPTQERAAEITALCDEHGWYVIVGVEPFKPEDMSDLDRALNPPTPARAEQVPGRNDPCPCGSGKKYKYCCGRR
jgi:SWIM/SEC-C metal-binding protein